MKSMKHTIIPKSDQLNSEELIGINKTITITAVSLTGSQEQPLTINFAGDQGKPYKPCKTMRKVLHAAWGELFEGWVGKSLTLYCDPDVRFGKEKVGGIRISHMTDIPSDRIELSLLATKGMKKLYTIHRLIVPNYKAALEQATTLADLGKAWEAIPAELRPEYAALKDDLKTKVSA